MAEAFHATPLKHHLRRALLHTAARLPVRACRPPAIERILLIRPDHLGDVLLTTPAVHALRQARPAAELHALVGPWSADVLAAYDDIDLVLTLAFPGFSRHPKVSWRSPYQIAWDTARRLRHVGYSSAVILRPDHWWGALVAFLAGIPVRVGYDLPDTAPFLTETITPGADHAVVQSLRLVEHWTGHVDPQAAYYRFPVSQADRGFIDGYLQEWGIAPGRALFCIHPGSGTWVKHWDENGWAVVADTLAEQLNAAVVFTGSDHELSLVRRIAGAMRSPTCIITGETRVGQLAALFARARVVLGPDSGPLHLAAAVGTPTVTLYGPADPLEFGPWGPRARHIVLASDIGCRPCRVLDWADDKAEHHPCMRDIGVHQVLEAARRAATSLRIEGDSAVS
jgi:heptosyltransferase-2/heptosyltransferase-3